MSLTRAATAASTPAVNGLLGERAWEIDPSWSLEAGVSPSLAAAVGAAVDQVRSVTGLTLQERPAGTGELRVNQADSLTYEDEAGTQTVALGAHTFLPSEDPLGGDMWFGRYSSAALEPGGEGFRAVLHELGHALGLTHADEIGPFGRVPPGEDSAERSVMSTRSTPGAPAGAIGTEPGGHARSFMVDDIAALQHLYGARYVERDDVYVFDPAERVLMQTVWDGGGRDTYDFSAYAGPLRIDLAPGGVSTTGQEPQLNRSEQLSTGEAAVFATGAIHNAALYRGDWRSGIENAIGGRGDDSVDGNPLDNRLEGRAGDDSLNGASGSDVLSGEAGADRIWGSAGADRLFGGPGEDWLYGGDDDDMIRGHGGGDRLRGGAGADALYGDSGDDDLGGHAGNDTLDGGIGADRLDGGEGRDLLVGGEGDDTVQGLNGRDTLRGGAGRDRLEGGGDDDVLTGAADDDELFASGGDDWLDGGRGHDLLIGGRGDDDLTGGRGDDTLAGGPGRDVFRFAAASGFDVIRDFELGVDRLDVADPAAALASARPDGADTILTVAGPDDLVRLLAVGADQLGPADFI